MDDYSPPLVHRQFIATVPIIIEVLGSRWTLASAQSFEVRYPAGMRVVKSDTIEDCSTALCGERVEKMVTSVDGSGQLSFELLHCELAEGHEGRHSFDYPPLGVVTMIEEEF